MKTSILFPVLLAGASLALSGGLALFGSAPAQAADVPAEGATLAVRFEGIEAPTGQIMMSLFDSADAHDRGGAPVRVARVAIENGVAVARFSGLKPGDYAVKAFHDVDGDGKMGTNPFGMPIEPFAFSNNARAAGGPARWEAARFAVAAGDTAITITIK